MYGPGDEETWGPITGHPNDQRTPEFDDDDDPRNEYDPNKEIDRERTE